jgi:hypothetical protein
LAKQSGRNGEKLRTGEYYDRVKDRYRARTSAGKMITGKHLPELRRKVRKAERGGEVHDAIRLDAHTDRWGDIQRERGRRAWAHSKALVVNHALPYLGHKRVTDISVRDLREWLLEVNRKVNAPKTAHDIHRALSACLALAVADEIILVNPAKNPHVRDLLPPLDPNVGGEAYDLDEVWALLTDPRVPIDRQMLNAGQAFTGMRVGESGGRRLGNLDWSTPVLPSLLIGTQYQDQPLKTARGADRKPRLAPVHPAYARRLTDWIEGGGYESIYGRKMPEDGFLVPDRRDPSRARTRNQLLPNHRTDCKRLGIEHKGTNGFKRFFETYAHKGGAREDILERITHNRKGTIVRVYIDERHLWDELCEAVLCLKLDLSRGRVISMGGRRGV